MHHEFDIEGEAAKLPLFPSSASEDFVYVIQVYQLIDGFDVVLWSPNGSGQIEKRTRATGPIFQELPKLNVSFDSTDQQSGTRSERIARLVEKQLASREASVTFTAQLPPL